MGHQILLVDQDHAQLERLSRLLHDGGHRVLRATGLAQAQDLMQTALPDLLLGASWLGHQLAWLQALRADMRTSKLPVIVMSHQADALSKIAALDAGADDYVVSPCDTGELLARIRAVLRRQPAPQTDDVVRAHGLRLDPLTLGVEAQTQHGPQTIMLSPLEFRLLHFLAMHPQRVHSRTQLLDRVWGNHVFVGERTVDVHIRKLRVALEGTLCDGLIQTVRGAGYRLMRQHDASGPLAIAATLSAESGGNHHQDPAYATSLHMGRAAIPPKQHTASA
jgi:two-component system phosphate regulon response regulator PhoB